ncbi:MAG: glutamine-hydrolyzing GMP synthase, partial [Nitrospirae bacterium]|nr:glutamine-hydrolyzing GMP synthase [Nitrospirota bacterium]
MHKLIVLDFGGQYAHLIANRIRRLGLYAEILEPDQNIDSSDVKGIILSGGPSSVYDKNAPKYDKGFLSLNVPVLGICYGLQLLAHELGGEVSPGKTKEYGVAHIDIVKDSAIFKNLSKREQVWMSHGDSVHKLPKGFDIIAKTADCPVAGIAFEKRKIYGVQFHPEVTHTPNGLRILENFIDICSCERQWSMKEYIKSIGQDMVKQANGRDVFMLVSGGVDSTVAFALLL